MFPNRRPATVALLLITGMIATGTLVGAVIVGATSGGATRDLTSVGALAVATRSLPRVWVVRRGDTYTAIVAKTHLTVAQLQQLNPTQDPNALLPGEHVLLHLRGPRVHVPRRHAPAFWIVRRGETYTSIADATGLQVADIAQLNPGINPATLVPGKRLKLRP